MSDTASQFSEHPIPSHQSSSQFSEQPISSDRPASETLASPPSVERRLRLWPGVAIIAVQWIAVTAIRQIYQGTQTEFMAMMFGPMVGAGAVLLWWLFASRLRWIDRLLIPAVCGLAGAAIIFIGDQSIGMMAIILYALPIAISAWVGWLVITYPLNWPIRRAGLVLIFMLVAGYYTLVRMDGVTGTFAATINWRWIPSKEQEFLAARAVPTAKAPKMT